MTEIIPKLNTSIIFHPKWTSSKYHIKLFIGNSKYVWANKCKQQQMNTALTRMSWKRWLLICIVLKDDKYISQFTLIVNEFFIIWFANLVKNVAHIEKGLKSQKRCLVFHTISSDLEQCWCKEPRQIRFYIYKNSTAWTSKSVNASWQFFQVVLRNR